MDNDSALYAFAFRALLTEEALDRTQRKHTAGSDAAGRRERIRNRLPIEQIDDTHVERATDMAEVYVAVAAFESSVREFIESRLLERVGESWWEDCVPDKRRAKAESRRDEENKVRWHASRGDRLIEYTELGDLTAIIATQWNHFEDIVESLDWAKEVIKTVERSRNVIMHGGYLATEDIERLGVVMRDWLNQVGG